MIGLGSERFDNVVDALCECDNFVGVYRRKHGNAKLVATQFAVTLGVDDAVLSQYRRDLIGRAGRLFLDGMIEYHEGAVRMAQSELTSGQSEAAKHLAREIIESQQREIEAMKAILGSL